MLEEECWSELDLIPGLYPQCPEPPAQAVRLCGHLGVGLPRVGTQLELREHLHQQGYDRHK